MPRHLIHRPRFRLPATLRIALRIQRLSREDLDCILWLLAVFERKDRDRPQAA